MNWYLLYGNQLHFEDQCIDLGSRDHLLEILEACFDIGSGGDVVLDLVDEGRHRDASSVCWAILAAARSISLGHLIMLPRTDPAAATSAMEYSSLQVIEGRQVSVYLVYAKEHTS